MIHPLPKRAFTAIALISSYLLNARQPEWSISQFIRTFLGIAAAQVALWIVWVVVLWPKLFSPLRNLPEPPPGSFFFGQFWKIAREPTGIPMREWISSVPNNGIMRYLGLFNQERILVTGPKALSEVLVTSNYDFEKPSALRFNIGRILGVGVLLAEGEEHKIQRKNLMPAFAFRHVKDLYPVFWHKTQEVVQAMTKDITAQAAQNSTGSETAAPKTAVIEVAGWASRVTLDIIGVAGLGRDFGAIKNDNTELNQTYRNLFAPNPQAQRLALLSLFLPDWFLSALPVQRNNDINYAANFIRAVCADLIAEKKGQMARKEAVDHDILTVALESGAFSDADLVDQLMTFLAAGHETTASAMTWAVYVLSKHPDIQAELRREVREKLPPPSSGTGGGGGGEGGGAVSSLDIDRMPYLNAVVSEVLRYYAPVPMTIRDAARDTAVQGQAVPKGTRVIIAPWATNFDKSLWGPDADRFNPRRWLDGGEAKANGNGGASSNYAFLTFLHGPRSCIGAAFAKAEFACLLAGWVGRFDFRLKNPEEMDEKNVKIKGGVTARPANGMYVHATVVDGW
ncbi:cytochrome P450 [Xylariomycetidae sp. FL0641]|nr:cytochrome P450 [Xylariomycetidae sp. FL0641]